MIISTPYVAHTRQLPHNFRRNIELAFGADFRDVRIHQSAAPDAIACTYGNDIYFAPGAYDLDSRTGLEVLGHELAHVLQQRAGRVHPGASRLRLEAEAAMAGRKIAHGEPVRIHGQGCAPVTGHRAAAQYYTVIQLAAPGPHVVVVANPQRHAPTQPQDTFIGQDKGGAAAASPSSFRTPAGAVNLSSAVPGTAVLRVSANGGLAIQDADLSTRQPKVFYATVPIINESNARLTLLGSYFQLVPDPGGLNQQQITVNGQVLVRVTPRNVNDGTAALAMAATESCNQLIDHVIGCIGLPSGPQPQFEHPLNPEPSLVIEYHVARLLLPVPPPRPALIDSSSAVNLATSMRNIAIAYATAARGAAAAFVAQLQEYGLNQYAAPEVGEGFVTSTLVAAAPGASIAMGVPLPTHSDYYRLAGVAPMVLLNARTWKGHFGGVVAKDGADVITLENYARNGEDASLNPDFRWYFQMYNTNPAAAGDSWHQAWTTTPMQVIPGAPAAVAPPHLAATHRPTSPGALSFANPITMRLGVPDARYDAIATAQYGAANVAVIRNDHGLIAGALDAQQELLEILKGLQYANTCLAAGQAGDANVNQQWVIALTHALTAATFRGNLQAIRHTYGKFIAMAQRR
jgi:hypothetical protein